MHNIVKYNCRTMPCNTINKQCRGIIIPCSCYCQKFVLVETRILVCPKLWLSHMHPTCTPAIGGAEDEQSLVAGELGNSLTLDFLWVVIWSSLSMARLAAAAATRTFKLVVGVMGGPVGVWCGCGCVVCVCVVCGSPILRRAITR